MNTQCPHCQKIFVIEQSQLPRLQGRRVKCSACRQSFELSLTRGVVDDKQAPSPSTNQSKTDGVAELGKRYGRQTDVKPTGVKSQNDKAVAETFKIESADSKPVKVGKKPRTVADIIAAKKRSKARAKWFLAGGGAAGLLAVAALFVFLKWRESQQSIRGTGYLVIEVPEEERRLLSLKIDGYPESFPASGEIRLPLVEDSYTVNLKREHWEYAEKITIKANQVWRLQPTWRAPVAIAPDSSRPARPALAAAGATPETPTRSEPFLFADWHQDLQAAKKIAKELGKSLMVVFDGSDWCPLSIKMSRNVFSHPDFRSTVDSEFVIVFIDFPRRQNRKYVKDARQNFEVADEYNITGYPTIVLADGDGQPYSRINAIADFKEFRDLLVKVTTFRQERTKLKAAITSTIESGTRVGERDILAFAQPGQFGYFMDDFENWKRLAAEKDADNLSGVHEQMLFCWLNGCLDFIDNAPLGKSRLNVLVRGKDELLSWSAKLQFQNKSVAKRLFGRFAQLFLTIDTAAATQLAAAAHRLEGGDQEIDVFLEKLASEIIAGGSGFVITPSGYVVTNYHVVGEFSRVEVQLGNDFERIYSATVAAKNPTEDLALLKIDPGMRLPCLPFNDEPVENLMETTVAGFPLLGELLSTNPGKISRARESRTNNMIAVDAKVNPGNSGGPLVNEYGQVIGVVTAKRESSQTIDSEGYAVPVDVVSRFLKQHLADEHFRAVQYKKAAGRKPAATTMAKQIEPAVARVMIKRDNMPLVLAESENENNWNLVLAPDRSTEEYQQAIAAQTQVVLSWPNGVNWRTLALGHYRLGQYAEALKATENACFADNIHSGLPNVGTLLIQIMAAAKLEKTDRAVESFNTYQVLSGRSQGEPEAWIAQLEKEMQQYLQVE